MGLQERKEKLLQDADLYRNWNFTMTKMKCYYGHKYLYSLEKAEKGDAQAYCLLGQMFEESVYRSMEHRDYDYPPFEYRKIAKIYYELAVISGYDQAACYLGKSYMSEKDYGNAEKWMLYAAEHGIKDSYFKLGTIYHEWWKIEKKEEYLEKAYTWKQKVLKEGANLAIWYDLAEFYRDILASGHVIGLEHRQILLSEMTTCYQKVVHGQDTWERCSSCEKLLGIFLGDYGTAPDIEKAVLYGKAAIKERSAYAAYRLGKYYVEQKPEEYEKTVYYLECAVDFPRRVDGARELFKQYLYKHKVPQYLYKEAVLLMEADGFYNLGRMYHSGKVVKKSMKSALYYYTRFWAGYSDAYERYSASSYNLAYYFMLGLQEEGTFIPAGAWEEMKSNRSKDDFHSGFSEDAAGILAGLNLRYHIIDLQEFQKQIQDIELVIDIPKDKLCNLQSDFYERGMMTSADQKHLQEYVTNLFTRLEESDTDSEVLTLYRDLVALSDYAADCTEAANSVRRGMAARVRRKISDAYLDKMLNTSLINKIRKCFGQSEKDYRIQCHNDYDNCGHNWPEACEKVKSIYKYFLEGPQADEYAEVE